MEQTGAAAPSAAVPGYYVWNAPGGRTRVHLKLEVIERLLPGVMTGFGAVPKRGAEVGGILLGTVEHADHTIIRIDDFEQVPCRYQRGPSYLLSEDDVGLFADTVEGYNNRGALRAVGYYRSHTREPQMLADDDRTICARLFPPPDGVVLLIRPYATKTSTAGFITYENGRLGDWPISEFPLVRSPHDGPRPLGRGGAETRRPRIERVERAPANGSSIAGDHGHTIAHTAPSRFTFGGYLEDEPAVPPIPADSAPPKRRARWWIWVPLSLLLLLVGGAAGFFAAQTGFPIAVGLGRSPFDVSLSATGAKGNVVIRWDRSAQPILKATRGALQISDGVMTRNIELSAGELRNGSVIFHSTGDRVNVRLDVFVGVRTVVSNATEWSR